MDGKNASGRKVSLLNDSSDIWTGRRQSSSESISTRGSLSSVVHSAVVVADPAGSVASRKLPALSASSRTSSYASSTSGPCSPSTPQLIRSDSSDSRTTMQTPSPTTPSFNFDGMPQAQLLPTDDLSPNAIVAAHGPYLTGAEKAGQYPELGQVTQPYYGASVNPQPPPPPPTQQPLPYFNPPSAAESLSPTSDLQFAAAAAAAAAAAPPHLTPPQQQQHQQALLQQAVSQAALSSAAIPPSLGIAPLGQPQPPVAAPNVGAVPAAGGKPTPPKKNQYPCPLAKQYNCSDYFTTSGHAARHAKKHTGKKDAFCPECNKAFTRKDNMEQHRRTHQTGRGSTSSAGSADSRSRKGRVGGGNNSAAAKARAASVQQKAIAGIQAMPALADANPMLIAPELVQQGLVRPGMPRPAFNDSLNFQPPMIGSALGTIPAGMVPVSAPQLSPSLSNGLDTLAIAASGADRTKFDA